MQIMELIIGGLIGCALSGLFVILGIRYQYYLEHKPLQKQSIFPEPFSCPGQSINSENRISTLGAQYVEFDFNKGKSSHDRWVSIVYEFNKYGVISKNDILYFEVVFEEGNFNQVDLEIKVPKKPKDKNCHKYNTKKFPIERSHDTYMKEPIPKTINFSNFDESEVHNIVQLCFVVKDDYNVDKNDRCYGKYRLQNMRITKK